jgi:SPP1 family predicted phage head-tail adaptor
MIGNLDQRAQLLANTLTPDGGGGFVEDWEAFASVWIALAPLGGSDAFGPDRLEQRVRHRIALRRRGDVAAGQRVAVGSRNFRIHTLIDEGPRSAVMILLCEELP